MSVSVTQTVKDIDNNKKKQAFKSKKNEKRVQRALWPKECLFCQKRKIDKGTTYSLIDTYKETYYTLIHTNVQKDYSNLLKNIKAITAL